MMILEIKVDGQVHRFDGVDLDTIGKKVGPWVQDYGEDKNRRGQDDCDCPIEPSIPDQHFDRADVRALAQAVRLGDRLEAEAMLDRIFGGTDLAEAVDLGRYNSATAKAAAKCADVATQSMGA